jgi:hypothetical protein
MVADVGTGRRFSAKYRLPAFEPSAPPDQAADLRLLPLCKYKQSATGRM